MVKFKGIEVTVQVAGADLKEYEDEDEAGNDDEKTVSKYIEAVSGAAFAVQVRMPKKYKMKGNAMSFHVSTDGTRGEHTACPKRELSEAGREGWVHLTKGVRSFVRDHWEHRDWQFSDIRLTEEPTLPNSQYPTPTEMSSLGEITIKVHRLNVGESKPPREVAAKTKTNPKQPLVLTEKKLKGGTLTHSVTMGQAIRASPSNRYDTYYLDGHDSPCATFKFKYRSKRALQSLLVIPRSPSPGPILPLEERDVDTLTPQELQELARRHQARYRQEQQTIVKPERRALKREREQDDDDSDTVTVVDTRTKRTKARPSADVEFVDLTG